MEASLVPTIPTIPITTTLPKVTINHLAFNHDASSFTVATNLGFRVYDTEPLRYRFGSDTLGSLRIAKALARTNIVAFVGDSANEYAPNKVIIWDHKTSQVTGQITCEVDVNDVEICRESIVVITRSRVYIHDINTLNALASLDTVPNVNALGEVSSVNGVVACLSTEVGRVKIHRETKVLDILCHDSAIYQMALNMEGTLLATASEKGTLIRIFDTLTGQNLQVVRRGADKACISTLRFSQDSNYLCVSSNKGTIHLYALRSGDQTTAGACVNKQSYLAQLAKSAWIPLPEYFYSEWSFAKIYLTTAATNTNTHESSNICAFYQGKSKDTTKTKVNLVIVLTREGQYYQYQFVPGKEDVKTVQAANWLV